MTILNPTQLETASYETQGWNAIYSTNFEKLNAYLAKFEDLWNSSPGEWEILRYDPGSGKWVRDTLANLRNRLRSLQQVNSDYTTSGSRDEVILADASGGSLTITLTNAANIEVTVKKIDSSSNPVEIVPEAGMIDGEASVSLSSQYEAVRLICDGSNWWKV